MENLADELLCLTDAVEHADPRIKREADTALAEFVFENRQDIVEALRLAKGRREDSIVAR